MVDDLHRSHVAVFESSNFFVGSRTFNIPGRTHRPLLILSPSFLPQAMTKYILVAGGVVSGIGKGVIGANVSACRLSSVVQNIQCYQLRRPVCS